MDIGGSLKQIEQIYQSINIYHAFYVTDERTKYDDAIISALKNEHYPIIEWIPGLAYLHKYRILVVELSELEQFRNDIEMFTLAMTSCDKVFKNLLKNPTCETLTLIKI